VRATPDSCEWSSRGAFHMTISGMKMDIFYLNIKTLDDTSEGTEAWMDSEVGQSERTRSRSRTCVSLLGQFMMNVQWPPRPGSFRIHPVSRKKINKTKVAPFSW
jgi:hypothetical protein